jgi:predicted MPP superfamily phosphohydrolase
MRVGVIVRIAVFILIFAAINGYVGLRGAQFVNAIQPEWPAWPYWIIFWIVAFSFLIARLLSKALPRVLSLSLTYLGAIWLAVLQYLLFLILAADIVRYLNRLLRFLPSQWTDSPNTGVIAGLCIWFIVAVILAYGLRNGRKTIVIPYELVIPKKVEAYKELHIVLVTDIHLGAINGIGRLRQMVDKVNGLKPDLVLLAGDIIDDEMHTFITHNMHNVLNKLESKLGVFSVLGNHEYYSGALESYMKYMKLSDVQVLIDEVVEVAGSLYVAGRDDISGRSHHGRQRKELSELLSGVPTDKPILLMDHQPYRLEAAEQAGVDLQVSGHTHRGQMFPFQYITRRIFELDSGYLLKGAMHVIVSSGFGTWGPPIRIGSRSEVISIKVKFT